MKVQLQAQALRLRIDEGELACLLAGDTLCNETHWPDGGIERQQLVLAENHAWRRDATGWCVMLAGAAVRELAARLPSREGLRAELPGNRVLPVLFDVDVRDSARQRYPKRPAAQDAT